MWATKGRDGLARKHKGEKIMAWETTEWACGHTGTIQLYGPQRQRDSRIASEAGRKCFACWLVEKWEQEGDPRATRPDRYRLAAAIAENKNIRIFNLPEDAAARKKVEKSWLTPLTQPQRCANIVSF